jgi:hypothetical protein
MKALLRLFASAAAAVSVWAPAPAAAVEVELGAQTLVTLVSNDAVKGGGVGAGVEASLPIYRDANRTNALLARARTSLLVGDGLAYTLELGAAFRLSLVGAWQPDAGAYLLYMGGDLARSIDADGYLAHDPWVVLAGLTPLRFALDEGWVSFCSARAGTTLGVSGHPALALSLTFFEVGRTF